MAKCGYNAEVSNGAKAGLTTFVVGAFASMMKRLRKPRRSPTPRTTKKRGG